MNNRLIILFLFCLYLFNNYIALDSKMSTQSAIEWVIERGNNMDNLMDAIKGNYQSVTALTSVLESGVFSKCILDEMIDQCKQIKIIIK